MTQDLSRRAALGCLAAAPMVSAAPASPQIDRPIVERHDASVAQLLARQEVNPASPYCGGVPDDSGLYGAGAAGQVLESLSAAYFCAQSKYHADNALPDRMKKAAAFLQKCQSPDGNISLLSTNFNSPPDTGFVVHNVATAAAVARRFGNKDVGEIPGGFLRKAAEGMAVGGVHTPNHRWVISSALAQVNELYPDARYVRRIDQWLAEGIDIDTDGQYAERSVLVYNVVSDRAFVVLAAKLGRPQLLEPVRRNLESMLYLIHADGEAVSEISRRQDLNARGDMGRYWFALQYMAQHDQDGRFATLARQFAAKNAPLSALLEYPELSRPMPADVPLPSEYEKEFQDLGIVRIRRGPVSATILRNTNRFLTLRRGSAIIEAVRFASAFFGKGQFVPTTLSKQGGGYVLAQSMQAPYYQPIDRKVGANDWATVRSQRKESEICRLQQSAAIEETKNGFAVRLRAEGTSGIPLAVEICLRPGGTVEGCRRLENEPDTWLLDSGSATYKTGSDSLRIGPGAAPHRYVQVRGADARLPGTSLYITGFTPFDHTLTFKWA